jgi:hypothetical protein
VEKEEDALLIGHPRLNAGYRLMLHGRLHPSVLLDRIREAVLITGHGISH